MQEEKVFIPANIGIYQEKFNNIERITAERLINYRCIVQEYLQLCQDKAAIIDKIASLKGVDYNKIKVQSGNGAKTTQQEHYVITLERINKSIWAYQGWLPDEQKIIKTQINRLTNPLYIEIITAYFINGKKWDTILREKLGSRSDFEANYTNYYRILMEWRKNALTQLEKISSQPYIPTTQQLQLERIKNEN